MSTLLVSHDASVGHLVPEGHPERPDRIRAVLAGLDHGRFAGLERKSAPLGQITDARICHTEAYLAQLEQARPTTGFIGIDNDTFLSPGSHAAVARAIGGAELCVESVLGGSAGNAFLAARPPGHHAERDRAMGFCFINTAAYLARFAKARFGIERVAIYDWDVHHGNGTQDIFADDRHVLYCSTHEMPLYPGTGAPSERGAHDNIVNVALQSGTESDAFRQLVREHILPRIASFRPELIVISAGFDAHHRDPLASIELHAADFGWATRELMAVADQHCAGRIVSVLEGGYDLQALQESTAAHVAALMGVDAP